MNFPILRTDRLILRQVKSEDAPVVLAGYSDPKVNQFMSVAYHNLSEVQVQLDWYNELYTNKAGIWWGFCLQDSGQMIGNGGFHLWNEKHRSAELGYWILPDFHRQKYASEAVHAMMKYGKETLNLHRVEAIVEAENQASSAMMSSLGFHLDGVRRECEYIDNRYISLEIWSKLSNEF